MTPTANEEWERIAPIFNDYEWHYTPDLRAALGGMEGLSFFEKGDRLRAVLAGRPGLETWGAKRREEWYRLTPPGHLHVPWRWNSGQTQEREAIRAARAR